MNKQDKSQATKPKTLAMQSPDFTEQNIQKLAELFPNCVTEAKNAKGELQKSIDFDLLKQELSANIVEGPRERYQLNWPGKREALLTANTPISKTLRPCREESVDFDNTENLFIEGDNLDALKLLQETYLGKVKMIYIDPPYNTGKDFIYSDNFTVDKDDYAQLSEQKDEDGGRLIANTESNGRFHSDWLDMMYPRLKLARNLLRDDGVIFISIDDNEVHNLRKVCDEVFGAENFIANIIWQKKYTRANDAKWFSDNHDHILCLSRNKELFRINQLPRNEQQLAAYKNPDNHEKGRWKATPLHAKSGTNTSSYTFSNGINWSPPAGTFRRFNDESMRLMDENNEIWFGVDGLQVPQRKSFLKEIKDGVTPVTIWPYGEVGHNHEANSELKELNISGMFSNPKPTKLLRRIAELSKSGNKNDFILDFFAGSATTAHAVMQLNAEDGGQRKFIMVQLPEVTDEKSEAFKAGYKTIAEISKERIRRAGKKILEEQKEKQKELDLDLGLDLDTGFRVLKVDSSNMKDVYYAPDAITQKQLAGFADNIKEDRSAEDLLFQVLLDWGVDLTLPIVKEVLTTEHTEGTEKKTKAFDVFFVDGSYDTPALCACFDKDINEDLVKQIAKREPLRAVFRDAGYGSDSTKINIKQIFKLMSPHTEVKAI